MTTLDKDHPYAAPSQEYSDYFNNSKNQNDTKKNYVKKLINRGSASQANLKSIEPTLSHSKSLNSQEIHPGLQNIQQRIKNLVDSTDARIKQQQMSPTSSITQ